MLDNGLALIAVEDGVVVAYNRYVTQAAKVNQELCADFNSDQSLCVFDRDSFSDWSGHKIGLNGKVLKQVH